MTDETAITPINPHASVAMHRGRACQLLFGQGMQGWEQGFAHDGTGSFSEEPYMYRRILMTDPVLPALCAAVDGMLRDEGAREHGVDDVPGRILVVSLPKREFDTYLAPLMTSHGMRSELAEKYSEEIKATSRRPLRWEHPQAAMQLLHNAMFRYGQSAWTEAGNRMKMRVSVPQDQARFLPYRAAPLIRDLCARHGVEVVCTEGYEQGRKFWTVDMPRAQYEETLKPRLGATHAGEMGRHNLAAMVPTNTRGI